MQYAVDYVTDKFLGAAGPVDHGLRGRPIDRDDYLSEDGFLQRKTEDVRRPVMALIAPVAGAPRSIIEKSDVERAV